MVPNEPNAVVVAPPSGFAPPIDLAQSCEILIVARVCYKRRVPKLVDSQQRRAELAEAVWTVIRRDGLQRASVRNVARQAGLSTGSLRHYFATQSELLCFAMRLVGDRAAARIAALEPAADARLAAERLLHELVPLDDERRAEAEVWVAFTGHALVDPQQRAIYERIHDQLNGACTTAIRLLVDAGLAAEGLDVALEAGRLHALLDGLALHAVMRPTKVSPSQVKAVIARHLDTLQASATPAGARPDPAPLQA
jgi:AcrR family transcriptional regulator